MFEGRIVVEPSSKEEYNSANRYWFSRDAPECRNPFRIAQPHFSSNLEDFFGELSKDQDLGKIKFRKKGGRWTQVHASRLFAENNLRQDFMKPISRYLLGDPTEFKYGLPILYMQVYRPRISDNHNERRSELCVTQRDGIVCLFKLVLYKSDFDSRLFDLSNVDTDRVNIINALYDPT